MLIRKANKLDVDSIAKIHVDVWNTTYTGVVSSKYLAGRTCEKQAEGWLERVFNNTESNEVVYVAEADGGNVVGFASGAVRVGNDSFDGELYTLYIFQEYQGRGIGRALFNTIASALHGQGAKTMILWVFAYNPACAFYEHLGGKMVDRRLIRKGGEDIQAVAYCWEDLCQFRGLDFISSEDVY